MTSSVFLCFFNGVVVVVVVDRVLLLLLLLSYVQASSVCIPVRIYCDTPCRTDAWHVRSHSGSCGACHAHTQVPASSSLSSMNNINSTHYISQDSSFEHRLVFRVCCSELRRYGAAPRARHEGNETGAEMANNGWGSSDEKEEGNERKDTHCTCRWMESRERRLDSGGDRGGEREPQGVGDRAAGALGGIRGWY